MADTQDTNDGPQGSLFSRPAFVIAGVVVLAIVLVGIVVAVRVATSPGTNGPPAQPPPGSASSLATPTAAPSTSPDPSASVCGLPGSASDELDAAPTAEWQFQGTIAYPSSREFGPGKTASEGYRYCFQHSPAGALMMAANAMAQGSDPTTGDEWARYALGQGEYRDQLIDELGKVTGPQGTRLKIVGFRMLSYTKSTARVDLGVEGSSQNQNLTVSGVYELVWQGGDWKISTDVERPFDISTVPDLSGYVPWGE